MRETDTQPARYQQQPANTAELQHRPHSSTVWFFQDPTPPTAAFMHDLSCMPTNGAIAPGLAAQQVPQQAFAVPHCMSCPPRRLPCPAACRRAQRAQVPLDYVLGVGGFELERVEEQVGRRGGGHSWGGG